MDLSKKKVKSIQVIKRLPDNISNINFKNGEIESVYFDESKEDDSIIKHLQLNTLDGYNLLKECKEELNNNSRLNQYVSDDNENHEHEKFYQLIKFTSVLLDKLEALNRHQNPIIK